MTFDSFLLLAFSGLFLGLVSATVSESFGHRIFGHPSQKQLSLYFRFPRFFAPFLRAYYHHSVIHHHKTFQKDILTQFNSDKDKQSLDTWITETFPEDFAQLIWKESYNLTLKGVQGILPFALPFLVGPLFIGTLLGPIAFWSSLITAFTPVLMSKFIHPLIHQPEKISTAHPLVQSIPKTPYLKRIFHNHYLHHLHEESNYNLLLGGDYLLGVHRKPSANESADFVKLWERFEHAKELNSH